MGRQVGFERMQVETNGLVPHGNKLRPRPGVRTCKKNHLMAEVNQCIAQLCDDPFGASIQTRRHCFIEWRNLSDPHGDFPLKTEGRSRRSAAGSEPSANVHRVKNELKRHGSMAAGSARWLAQQPTDQRSRFQRRTGGVALIWCAPATRTSH